MVFLTNQSGEEFVAQARRCGHGYVAKLQLYSDLHPAICAALEGKFFASRFRVSLRSLEPVAEEKAILAKTSGSDCGTLPFLV